MIETMLQSAKNNYNSYILWNTEDELLNRWKKAGVIEKGIRKSKINGFPDKEICILKKENDLKLY